MRSAATAATTAKPTVSAAAGSRAERPAPSRAGPVPAAAKSSPVRSRTCPSRLCASSAVNEVTATISRLAVVAATGERPSR